MLWLVPAVMRFRCPDASSWSRHTGAELVAISQRVIGELYGWPVMGNIPGEP